MPDIKSVDAIDVVPAVGTRAETPTTARVDVLLVGIGDQQVFVRVSEIKKVLRAKVLTPVPMGPAHLKGLANVHGQIVCIIDAGGVTSLPHSFKQASQSTRFLLLRHSEMHVAIWVDRVYKVVQLDADVLAKADENNDSVWNIIVEDVSYSFLQCTKLLH